MKKLFVDNRYGYKLISVDGIHFHSNIDDGQIYAAPSLNAKAGTEIIKIIVARYTRAGKEEVMKKLFKTFVDCLDKVDDILTIVSTENGTAIFKNGDTVLYTFDPDNEDFILEGKSSKKYTNESFNNHYSNKPTYSKGQRYSTQRNPSYSR